MFLYGLDSRNPSQYDQNIVLLFHLNQDFSVSALLTLWAE